MAVNRTLLERLRNPGPAGERRLQVSTSELFESILNNLHNILNTTHGNSLTDPRYGLPHMTAIRSRMPLSIASFEAAIRYSIEKFEPRLKNVRVRHAPHKEDGCELRFEISGIIQDEGDRTNVRFETYADDDGRLQIK